MLKSKIITPLIVSLSLISLGVIPAAAEVQEETISFSQSFANPCAVFVDPTADPAVSRISYTEGVGMDFTLTSRLDNENQWLSLRLDGEGIGLSSNLDYSMNAYARISQDDFDTEDPEINFYVNAELISEESGDTAPNLFSEAAGITFRISMTLVPGEIDIVDVAASDFQLSCQDEDWDNLTSNSLDNGSGGKGFGDPWNKYAWSMKDFKGKMYVGTKNATYNYLQLQDPDVDVAECETELSGTIPQIYLGLACLELFDSDFLDGNIPGTESRPAEIWAYDYGDEQWSATYPGIAIGEVSQASQGFRVMEVHDEKLYAGSDLGSFIMGVELGSETIIETDLSGDAIRGWNFPGSKILVNDGENGWLPVDCEPSEGVLGPCNSSSEPIANSALQGINVSFRALASHDGDLYLGTFNFSGAELWKYEDDNGSWTRVAKFNGQNGLPFSATISELKSFNDKLIIGLGFGQALSSAYLWEYDTGVESISVVPGLPSAPTASSVFKLFVSDSDELYVGLVDFIDGFDLLGYKPSRATDWRTISTDGFGSYQNRYVWSMEEHENKLYLGTFNTELLSNAVPRGSAELWMSEDDGITWQQQPMPLRFSLLNYGIRTMAVGDGELFMGSASNMLAPDLLAEIPQLPGIINIGAGAEVWRTKKPLMRRAPIIGIISQTPMAITVTSVGSNSATISWTAMPNASGYRIYLDNKMVGQVSHTVTSHTFKGLSKDSTHQVKVTALMGAAEAFFAEHSIRTNGSKSLKLKFGPRAKLSSKSSLALTELASSITGKAKIWIELKPVKASSGLQVSKGYKLLSNRRLSSIQSLLAEQGLVLTSAEVKKMNAGSSVASGRYIVTIRYSHHN
jgi:hypothetical protein